MSNVFVLVKDETMTEEQLNRLVKLSQSNPSNSASAKKLTRNARGNPRPYLDGNRWKAPGYFVDQDGNKIKVYGTGAAKKTALASRDKLIQTRSRESRLSRLPDGVTLASEYMSFWLEKIKQPQDQLDYKTLEGYRAVIQNWIKPNLGKLKLGDLKRPHLVALFEVMRMAGLSRSSQNQVRSVIKPALDYAVIEGHILSNPFVGIKLQKSKHKLPEFFDELEVARILNAAKENSQELKWHIALLYGLRQGERLGLTWSDIDLDVDTP